MNTAHLTVVPQSISADAQTPLDRIRRLHAEAQSIALDHVGELERALETVTTLAGQIAAGGEAYPAGVRDLCRRLADDANWRASTVAAITQRH